MSRPAGPPSLDFALRHVPPDDRAHAIALSDAGAVLYPLERRGVDHGFAARGARAPEPSVDPAARWAEAEPVYRPRWLDLAPHGRAIRSALETFDALRDGARFLDVLEKKLRDDDELRYAGSTIDKLDAREIEKVFVDVLAEEDPHGTHRRYHARDLWAKLSWIADDPRDLSLRVRFSFGHEATRDWLAETARLQWSDRFAARVFPECAAIEGHEGLAELLRELCGAREYRLTERIVYNNVPGGGAVFHHDADPGQLGVVYAQLAGETAWLALPKRRLAATVSALADGPLAERAGTVDAAWRALDDDSDPLLAALLNATPELTARVAAHGGLFLLEPGDVLLLPSREPEQCCWHAVFGTGEAPSLGHSYALFSA